MSYRKYIEVRERRSPEFRARRQANQPVFDFQLALIRARLDAGLTQKELAERIGKPQTSVARWENGTNIPKLETLQRLSGALGVSFRITDDRVTVEELQKVVTA